MKTTIFRTGKSHLTVSLRLAALAMAFAAVEWVQPHPHHGHGKGRAEAVRILHRAQMEEQVLYPAAILVGQVRRAAE